MLKQALTTVALVALSAPAFAGGLAAPAPEPAVAVPVVVPTVRPSADWTGFYGGVHLGYGDILVTHNDGADIDAEGNDTLYGVHAGYMYDLGNIVLGGELAWTDLSGIALTRNNSAESMLAAKLRVGYDMGRVLPYAVAGMARVEATDSGTSVSDNFSLLGAGVDFAMNDNWRIGAEYNHVKADDFAGTPGVEAEADVVTLRVSFSF